MAVEARLRSFAGFLQNLAVAVLSLGAIAPLLDSGVAGPDTIALWPTVASIAVGAVLLACSLYIVGKVEA
jgi:hypothetical protein